MPLGPMMGDVPGGPVGPGGEPSDSPGSQAQSLSMVREAVRLLQQALPGIPLGSDPHKDVLKAITSLSKSVPPSAEIPGIQTSTLAGLQKSAQDNAVLRQLAGAMGQGPAVPAIQPPMGA